MDKRELLNINPAPFPEEWEEWEALLEHEQQRFLALALGFAYFEKLAGGDVRIPMPNMNSLKREICRQNLHEVMEWAGGTLLSCILGWSSFEMELIDLTVLEDLTETRWEAWLQMDNKSRSKELLQYQNQLFTEQQMNLFRQMPDPILNSIDFQYSRTAVYLFSKKLADYLWFADENRSIIENQFSQEHRQIRNALALMRYPIQQDEVQVQILQAEYYIIGFHFGADLDAEISYKDLDWNFFCSVCARKTVGAGR